jgi:two-component system sensor histidine kinase KdpD
MDNKTKLLNVLLALNDVSQHPKLGFQEKLNRIIEVITGGLRAENGSVMLKKGRKKMEVVASTNPAIVGLKQGMDEDSPSAFVARTGKLLYVDKKSKNNKFSKRHDRYNKKAFVVVPIVRQGRVTGVINITDKIGDDQFSQDEQEILIKVAGQVISEIENQRLTDELKKKSRTLQQRNRQLKHLEQLKTDLFRMLIHDLKGPISEVIANLDILSYTSTEENLAYVNSAKNGCDTLYRMVSNLLDIARLEEGKLKLLYERIDPVELIKEALARVHWTMEARSLEFIESFPGTEQEVEFWADRGILQRVLQNLLVNAATYSPSGGVIGVGFDFPEPDLIQFHVEDSGPGVPPEHHKVIFDKFAQLDKKGDGRIYTTGLGLTFCKMAIEEAHKGRIYVESDGKFGSRFVFSLPLGIRK